MLASACVINNIHRRFPVYWWTPVDLGDTYNRGPRSGIEKLSDAEREDEKSDAASDRLGKVKTWEEVHYAREREIRIRACRITTPDWLEINDWERNVLEILRQRLKVYPAQDLVWSELDKRGSETTAVSGDGEKSAQSA